MKETKAIREMLYSGKRPLFMAHMIAGYPTMGGSKKVAKALAGRLPAGRQGADIIELQIPFSDPMADGPTISIACQEALAEGATVAASLKLLKDVAKLGKPVAVMSYLNPVFRYGIPRFVKSIRDAGASALIVPDCPFDSEEGRALIAACRESDIHLIPVVSPGVPAERLKMLAKDASGFVYCTSRQGITGATSKFSKGLADFVNEARRIFDLPVAVGFGVRTRADVKALAKFADIIIAGSVFVDAVRKKGSVEKIATALTS